MGDGEREQKAATKGARRGREPRSAFHAAVREAYEEEHGIRTDKEIAERLGVSPPTLPPMFDDPARITGATLSKFVNGLSFPSLQRSVLAAWQGEAIGRPAAGRPPTAQSDAAAEVMALVARDRPEEALVLLRTTDLGALAAPAREQAVMMRAMIALRLDAPGDALGAARALEEQGRTEGRPDMVAAGLAVRARAFRGASLPPSRVRDARVAAVEAVAALPEGLRQTRQAAFAADLVYSEVIADVLRQHARQGGREADLRSHLEEARRRYWRASQDASRAAAKLLEARLLTGLGDSFAAEEALEEARSLGGDMGQILFGCGLAEGEALAARGLADDAVVLLGQVSDACLRRRYHFYFRLAQEELARLLALRRG